MRLYVFILLLFLSCKNSTNKNTTTGNDETCSCSDGTTVNKDEVVCISERRWKCVLDDDSKKYKLKPTSENCDEEDVKCSGAVSQSLADSAVVPTSLRVNSPTNSKDAPCHTYTVDYIPNQRAQLKNMDCWATVLTMMYEYKRKSPLNQIDIVKELKEPFQLIFDTDAGLLPDQQDVLVAKVGLKFESPGSISVQQWCELLRSYGPIWVTADQSPHIRKRTIHARVLYKIDGITNPANPKMYFINPSNGNLEVEDFNDFLVKYEAELRKKYAERMGVPLPPEYQLRVQVIHW